MKRLQQAKAALSKKPETALPHLVAAWSERPLPELAALVDRYEAVFPSPPFEGTTKDFLTAAKRPSATTLGSLVKALVAPKTADTIERLHALAPHRDDPRVAGALLALVRDVPWTSNGARPVFTEAFAVLVKGADARLLAAAPSLPAGWKFRENQREWLQRQLELAVEAVSAARKKKPLEPLTKIERELVKAIEAGLVSTAKPKPSGTSKEALLAEIYANPDDDGPRLVLADWLLERGDPQGEFITLQFKADKTKQEKAREAALQAKHGTSWLGALATVVLKDVVFRRGFPSKVVARFKGQREAEQFGDAREWATIEELSWSQPGAWSEADGHWHQFLPTYARPKVCTVERFGLAQLLEAKKPWPIESLSLTTRDVEMQKRLAASSLFPKVRSLRVGDSFAPQLLATGWLRDVQSLAIFAEGGRFSGNERDFAPFLDALSFRERLGFETDWSGNIAFSRGSDGRLSKVHLSGASAGQTKFLFQHVSPGLRGRMTAFTSDGLPADVAAQFEALVGPSGPVPSMERSRVQFLAAAPRQGGWTVVRSDAILLTDEVGVVASELPINETSVAAFSPDGKLVACAFDRRLDWRDAATGALVVKEKLDTRLHGLSFSLNGAFLLLHSDRQVETRRWPERTPIFSAKSGAYPKKPTSAQVSDDGAIVASMYNEELRVIRDGQKRPTVATLKSFSPTVLFVGPSTFVVSSREGVLQQFELAAPDQPTKRWPIPESRLLLLSPDRRRLLAGPEQAYAKPEPNHVLDLETGTVTVFEDSFKALAWSADGRRLLGSNGFELVVRAIAD